MFDLEEMTGEERRAFKEGVQRARDAIEAAVLASIAQGAGAFGPGEAFWHFSHVESDTGLPREYVRAACRSLTDQGLAQYSHTLCDEDGEFRGAGYAATQAGLERLRRTGTERESVVGSVVAPPPEEPTD